jgi:phage shock protein PspC (stress-responsive transcriptional regulator)
VETGTKRLYRLSGDRKIAGVCSGLGEHFDMDPLIFRLFFLFSVFFGGLGVLAYVIMWILVPLKDGSSKEQGVPIRLHLSSTDRKIAGVCGGLGEYFTLDPVFFRAGFVILAFACGAGILLYFVLWLLLPRAQAPASASGANVITA